MSQLEVRPADRTEWPAALDMLFQHQDAAVRTQMSVRTEALLRSGELNSLGLLVACQGTEIVGAMLCTPAPGAVGLVWPPQAAVPAERMLIEDALARAALRWLRLEGVKLAQLLTTPEEERQVEPLRRHGFRRVTTLLYLTRPLSEPIPTAESALRFLSYTPETEQRFAATLARTYEGSADCPEVNGVRTVAEVLAGHRAQGIFTPQHWWLVRSPAADEPAGVLLVSTLKETLSWELLYMGLVPEARGRGLGRQLALHTLQTAKAEGVAALDLCVDSRNLLARRVYEGLGFQRVTDRIVYLAALGSASLSEQL